MPVQIKDSPIGSSPDQPSVESKQTLTEFDKLQSLVQPSNSQPDVGISDPNIDQIPIFEKTTNSEVYDVEKEVETLSGDFTLKGYDSIINRYAVYTFGKKSNDNKFKDDAGSTPFTTGENDKRRNPTLDGILSDFDEKTNNGIVKPYFATDFLYSKHFNRIPLNHLITLRRYTFPTYDNFEFLKQDDGNKDKDKLRPLAQAITYFGDQTDNKLSDITKMAGFINWKKLESDVWDVEGNNERSSEDGPAGALGQNWTKIVALATGNSDVGQFKQQAIDQAKFNKFEYTNKVLGPVNVVNQTYTRDRGLGVDLKFELNFEYELRSYNSINPRIAMLDLMCNMLALTFNNARFWGGANRYFPKSPQFSFLGDEKAFYAGNYGDYATSFITSMGDALGAGASVFGEFLTGFFGGGNMGELLGKTGKLIGDYSRAQTMPQVLGMKALLTGYPVGEWHMTVGNPYHPIMQIGNLIVKDFDFNFDGHLGVDDFPSHLKFKINLESGRPRDKGDVESIFNFGQGRMYYPAKGLVDILNSSSTTRNSQASTGGGGTINPKDVAQIVEPPSYGKSSMSGDFAQKLVGTVF